MTWDGGESLRWPVERWRELQVRRLGAHLRATARCGLYRGVRLPAPGDISVANLDEIIGQLPLTTKDQLAAASGEDLWGGEYKEVAEWVCTSGTLGKPLYVPLLTGDLQRLEENEAVALDIAGVGQGDLLVLAVGMERLFVAGLAYWLGGRRLGAACVRVGPRLAEHRSMLRELLGQLSDPRNQRAFVIAVPSYLTQVEPPEKKLAGIIAIGEPVKTATNGDGNKCGYNTLGHLLHKRFGCPVMSTYANTETCTSFAEGPSCSGGHLNPHLGLVEIIGPDGQPTDPRKEGEVVITPLGAQGLPLLRFRTGDIATLFTGPCACGRTTPRLGPIVGRMQQLLKFRGTSVYPSAVFEALRNVPEIADFVLVAESEQGLSDRLTVNVSLQNGTTPASVRDELEGQLRRVLRVLPELQFIELQALKQMQLSQGSRKPQCFIDRRKQ